jgi:ZIP family zinc transporter
LWQAFAWGALASASIYIGEALAGPLEHRPRVIGLVMGFGAGAMLSAVAYELIPPSHLGKVAGIGLAAAFLAGMVVYVVGDQLADRAGGSSRQQIAGSRPEAGENTVSGTAIFLGSLLDGIPESYILGITLAVGGAVSIAFLAAVFTSNIPQGIAGTVTMRSAGRSGRQIFWLWTGLTVACALSAGLGYAVASNVQVTGYYSEAFAAGAVLTMLADSMMPEAFRNGGRWAGVMTVVGYIVAASLGVLQGG